jgi:hypothetical protein
MGPVDETLSKDYHCLDYRLAVKHTKPQLLSLFHDCWRIISSERNRGGLPSSVSYGDFVVAWAGIDVMFVAFVFSGECSTRFMSRLIAFYCGNYIIAPTFSLYFCAVLVFKYSEPIIAF